MCEVVSSCEEQISEQQGSVRFFVQHLHDLALVLFPPYLPLPVLHMHPLIVSAFSLAQTM